jgi:hypothetical protein
MPFLLAAAVALAADATPNVAGAPVASNLESAMPIAGRWTFAPTAAGSEATFATSSGQPQLTIQCTRATRRIALIKPGAASPSIWVWTSSQKKSLPATYDAAAARVRAELPAFDSLLDAIAFSRGRFGVSVTGSPVLVLPAWPEVARVIDDCRG